MVDSERSSLDAASTVHAFKRAAISTLESADASVRIEETDYFNHTYVPDLLLTWPKDGSERSVYLRTTGNPTYLLEDLSLLDGQGSIVMPLGSPVENNVEAAGDVLKSAAMARRALIAGPAAFAELGRQGDASSVAGLASRALIQGGNGVVGENVASNFARQIANGFDAAQLGDGLETAAALDMANSYLDQTRSDQVSDFLHAVWVGSGEDGLSFPGESGLSPHLSADSLALLLETVPDGGSDFWQRLSRNVTMTHISQLSVAEDNVGFQQLMGAASRRIRAKAGRVVSVGGAARAPRWFANRGELGLVVAGVTILFTDGRISGFSREGIDSDLSIPELKYRADRANIAIADVKIGSPDRRVEYATADGTSVTDDVRFLALQESVGEQARIASVAVPIGWKPLNVDFESSTARGHTVSKFYLSDLVLNSLPLLVGLSATETERMIEFFEIQ